MEPPPIAAKARYTVERIIGKGGLGEVFQAWDAQLQRRVALKRLGADGANRQSAYDAALREATCLAALQHPNIVTLYDFGADEAGPFVVMELVEGETLDEVVARGAFPLADFILLARQSLEGLAAAHRAGLLHRDLKPGNLMLQHGSTGFLQVKILDFGISNVAPESEAGNDGDTILGTVEFMAPEQLERQPFDQRSDLYALGCIFYYTLTGVSPFRGPTVGDVMTGHLQGNAAPLAEVRRDLPPALCDWIARLMSRQPADRPATTAEAIVELNRVLETMTPPAAAASSRRLQGLVVGGGIAALLVGFGAGAFWGARGNRNQPPLAKTNAPPLIAYPSATAKIYRADDLLNLRLQTERSVTVEGTAASLRRDPAAGAYYLNFATDYTRAVSLVFFQDAMPAGMTFHQLENLANKPVRARGKLKAYQGALQIVIQRTDQLEIDPKS
jgi:hypothetical protein